MIYVFCFLISCLLIWFGENNRKYFITSRVFFLLALIIPAALAGLRDPSIGFDTMLYTKPFFDDVVSSPNLNAVSPQWDFWIEPGYRWLNFIVAKFTDDVHWFFFWIIFLQNSFVFLGFYFYRDKVPVWLGMLCYYFCFFCYSLCFARESLVMSVLFFAFHYLLNKSYIKYAIFALVLVLFHKSALLALLLIPFHIYASKFESDRAKFILMICLTVFFFTLEKILGLALEFFNMDYLERALWYASENETEYTWRSHAILIAVFFPPFAFFYWKRKEMYSIGKEYHFFFLITIICLLFSQIIALGPWAYRFVTVFKWFLVLVLPMSLAVYKNLPSKQFLLKISIVCYSVYYWFFLLVHRDRENVLPYSSSFLNSIF
jgi:hypothetical protein